MKVSVAQMNSRVGDFDHTVERMVAQSKVAAGKGSSLLVFPTPVLTGPDPGGLSESEEFFFDLSETLDRLSKEAACACLVPIVVDMGEGITFEAVLVRNGEVMPLRLASYLTSYARSGEQDDEVSLDEPVEFEHEGVSFGIAFDNAALEEFAEGEADVEAIVFMPFYCYNTDDEATALAPSVSDGCFVKNASDANAWIIAAGAVGGYDEHVFTGGSFVMAPWGELAGVAPSFEEQLITCDMDVLSEGPLANPSPVPGYQRAHHLWEALVVATRDFVLKQDKADVTLGLDGGLTSSAVAALAVDALGPTHVHALILPDIDDDAAEDVRTLVHDLRIEAEDVRASGVVDAAKALLPAGVEIRDIAQALIVAMAREHDACVLGNLDKTAQAVGGAESGCSCASFAPFGDVYRTDVASLVRQRNTVSPVIPVGVLARLSLPSDVGFARFAATPEAQLNELDAMLLLHVERGMGLPEIIDERANPEVTAAILERVQAREATRRTIPMYPVVSDCTFSERGWPVALSWHDRVREGWTGLGEEGLRQGVEEFLRTISSQEGTPANPQHQVSDVMGFLRDFSQGGGMRSDGDDLWGQGLFSNN